MQGTAMQGTGIRWLRRAAAGFAVSLVAMVALMQVTTAYAAEPTPHGSLAGSRAGVGRTPPGRPPLPVTDFDEPALPPPPAEPSAATPPDPRPEQPAAARPATAARDTEPLVNVVPLGAGLLLTGLGIGFLAVRLRR